MTQKPDDTNTETALATPDRVTVVLKGEAAARLSALATRQGMYPSGVVRGLVDAAFQHVTEVDAQAKAEAEAMALKAKRKLLAAATLDRKVAALEATQKFKGVEIFGSRFRAFVENHDGTREQLGVFSTAEEAAQAHDGELWERMEYGAFQGLTWDKFPKSAEFNWPLRDDYTTANETKVAEARRAYFLACIKAGVIEDKLDRGFLRPEVDTLLIAELAKIDARKKKG